MTETSEAETHAALIAEAREKAAEIVALTPSVPSDERFMSSLITRLATALEASERERQALELLRRCEIERQALEQQP